MLLDEQFLSSTQAMSELAVMMAGIPRSDAQSGQPEQSARAVVPVVLMDLDAVKATYKQHWTPAARKRARSAGLLPATLSDLRRLLTFQPICMEWVRRLEALLSLS